VNCVADDAVIVLRGTRGRCDRQLMMRDK